MQAVSPCYLVGKECDKVDGLGNAISVLDYILSSRRKRHIVGGILLSASMLFGGLALTVMTIKNEGEDDE